MKQALWTLLAVALASFGLIAGTIAVTFYDSEMVPLVPVGVLAIVVLGAWAVLARRRGLSARAPIGGPRPGPPPRSLPFLNAKRWVWVALLVAAAGTIAIFSAIILAMEEDLDYAAPAVVLGIGLLLLSILRPDWGFLLFTVTLPIQDDDYALVSVGGAVIRIADAFALPVFIGWLISRMFVKKEGIPFRKTGIEIPLLAFALYVYFSGFWSTDMGSVISKVLQLVYAYILFYMTADLVRTRKQLMQVLWGWVFGGLLMTGSTFYDYATGEAARAASSLSGVSLVTGEYLNYPIFLGISLLFVLKEFWPFTFVLAASSSALAALIVTESRGPIIGCAAALMCLAFCRPVRGLLKWIPTALVLVLPPVLLLCFALDINVIEEISGSFERFWYLVEYPMSDIGVRTRVALWIAGWEAWKRNPIFGIGIGSLADMVGRFMPREMATPELLHNLYLEMFVLFGAVGFPLFCYLLFRLTRILTRAWKEVVDPHLHALLIGVASALFAQAVGWATYGKLFENRIFWVVCGLAVGIARINRAEKEAPGGTVSTDGPEGRSEPDGSRAGLQVGAGG